MEHLTVYSPPYPKVRLGKQNDGGYVICDMGSDYDILLSGGIDTDTSFEEAVLTTYPTLKGFAFDGMVSSFPPPVTGRLQCIQKNLGDHDSDTVSTLSEYFKDHSNIFLKLDIEGGENDLFSSFLDDDLLKIKQLVIEFHSANQVEIPRRLMNTHWLVHLHPNNCCGVTNVNGIFVPNIFECTYIRKEPGQVLTLNTRPIPDPELDQKNVEEYPDLPLTGLPFVHDIYRNSSNII